ncbi:hypothetical protein, partial [Methanoregula sp.]|uniref:hypothetical protein n=1 Tax=Methanoregula sp. TaxID=2052170 RepID=UPI0025D62DDF
REDHPIIARGLVLEPRVHVTRHTRDTPSPASKGLRLASVPGSEGIKPENEEIILRKTPFSRLMGEVNFYHILRAEKREPQVLACSGNNPVSGGHYEGFRVSRDSHVVESTAGDARYQLSGLWGREEHPKDL